MGLLVLDLFEIYFVYILDSSLSLSFSSSFLIIATLHLITHVRLHGTELYERFELVGVNRDKYFKSHSSFLWVDKKTLDMGESFLF